MTELVINKIPATAKKIYDYHWVYMGICMIVVAFMGWVGENIFRCIVSETHTIDNRFMILPFIAPYGLAVFAAYYILGTPNKMRIFKKEIFRENTKKDHILSYVFYSLTIFITIALGEIVVGTIYEAITGLTLWNYSNIPLHITKFTSIPTTSAITLIAVLLMRFAFEPFMNLMERKMNYKVALYISTILGSLIILDCLIMMFNFLVHGEKNIYWHIDLSHNLCIAN